MKIEVNTHEKYDSAAEHPEVLVMSADLGSSCEVKVPPDPPDRYLTMGIAEQNMCSWAAACAVKATVRSCTPLRYSCIAASSIS